MTLPALAKCFEAFVVVAAAAAAMEENRSDIATLTSALTDIMVVLLCRVIVVTIASFHGMIDLNFERGTPNGSCLQKKQVRHKRHCGTGFLKSTCDPVIQL